MIIFLTYNIKIHDESSDFEDIDTLAKCWVKASTIEAADLIVRNELKQYKWEILNLQDGREVNEDDYRENRIERDYFNTAITKDKLIVIDTKPKRKSLL